MKHFIFMTQPCHHRWYGISSSRRPLQRDTAMNKQHTTLLTKCSIGQLALNRINHKKFIKSYLITKMVRKYMKRNRTRNICFLYMNRIGISEQILVFADMYRFRSNLRTYARPYRNAWGRVVRRQEQTSNSSAQI